SLPEVAGNAAQLIDPAEPAALAEAMANVMSQSDLQFDMKEKGLAQAAQFSWDKTAQQTAAIYGRVVSHEMA
ncbi:MAG: glycosyltransferase family 1 protein, partial [Anaerolineae bacterium]|nr:glycosyltransferase family 1 protein [Anaerolineae bacterium]